MKMIERIAIAVLTSLAMVSCRSGLPPQEPSEPDSAQAQQPSPSTSDEQSHRKLDAIKSRHNLIHIGGNSNAVTVVTGLMTREQLDQIENEIKSVMGAQCKVAFIIK